MHNVGGMLKFYGKNTVHYDIVKNVTEISQSQLWLFIVNMAFIYLYLII